MYRNQSATSLFARNISHSGNGMLFSARDQLREQLQAARSACDADMVRAAKKFLRIIDEELDARYETGLKGHN